jgi:hypothetical protein
MLWGLTVMFLLSGIFYSMLGKPWTWPKAAR